MLYRVIQWYTFRIKRENSQNNSRRKSIFYDKLYFLCPTRIVQLFAYDEPIFTKKANSFFFFFQRQIEAHCTIWRETNESIHTNGHRGTK